MNRTRLAAYLLLIWMEKNEMKWNKTRSNKKNTDFLDWNFCIRLFEVHEREKTKLKKTLTEFFESGVWYSHKPFRSAKQPAHKEYGLFSLHCARSCSLFYCVCAIIVCYWWVSVWMCFSSTKNMSATPQWPGGQSITEHCCMDEK